MDRQILTKYTLLQSYVKDIRTLESQVISGGVRRFNFFADGTPGIMFYLSEEDLVLGPRRLPSLFLYGQTVKPIEITATGNFRIILLLLYPHVIKSLFGVEASDLTDCCIDMDELPFAAIRETKDRLMDPAHSVDRQVELLVELLTKLVDDSGIRVETGLQHVTNSLFKSGGNVPLKLLQDDLKVSQRTFERLFMKHVGVTPRLFARICRFHTAVHKMNSGNYQKLTDIAYDTGFADQAHFIRTFKEFTGVTPKKYLKKFQTAVRAV